MMKRSIAIVLLLVLVGGLLIACEDKKVGITQDEAVKIALDDMGITEADTTSIHIHEGTHMNELCFNVYISTADGGMTYVVSRISGNILQIAEGGGHSH
jgi:predicted small secreted protein